MSETSVLWLDNDRAYLQPYVDELVDQGFAVTVVETATEAEQRILHEDFAYVIIDIMVPTRSEAEEAIYAPDATSMGYRTGVVFWRRIRARLLQQRTAVLFFTVRLDEDIREELARDGLPRENFATKYQLSDTAMFVERLRSIKTVAKRAQ